MRRTIAGSFWTMVVLALLATLGTANGQAQIHFQDPLGDINNGRLPAASTPAIPHKVELIPPTAKPGEMVTLRVTVNPGEKAYTYSTSQEKNKGAATKIAITAGRGLEPVDDQFSANHKPKTVYEPLFGYDVEKYVKPVSWSRRFYIADNAQPADVSLTGELRYQICDERNCKPYKESFTVALGGAQTVENRYEYQIRPIRKVGQRQSPDNIAYRFRLTPENAKPGETVTLNISAKVDPAWHTFALIPGEQQPGKPTKITLETLEGLRPVGETFTPSKPYKAEKISIGDFSIEQNVHYGQINWTRKFTVLDSAESAGYGLRGTIDCQLCNEGTCLTPNPMSFALGTLWTVPVGGVPDDQTEFDEPVAAGPVAFDFKPPADTSSHGLVFYLISAFFGGMILNIMPCVLPVLAIKLLSFVQQAGEDRGRILALNVAYSVGVVGVFLILATLAVSIGLGWGGLFQNSEFNLVMACLVFAMGLSLLGVFEIPVPGFVGSAAGGQQQEGLLGAFLTGIFATLLATPCSGPFLGVTLGWSVQQSPTIVYLVWGTMGLGMAFPYLVFGLFPGAIKLLPKPGTWMVRFKELAGFVLMATVIFFVYFLEKTFVVPLLVMLLGIALGLWMLGSLYQTTSPPRHKNIVRVAAVSFIAIFCTVGYGMSQYKGSANELAWEGFSEERLLDSVANKKTVLVDFTADWCLTCKMVEKTALNTRRTKEFVEDNGVVTLYADYTNESAEIKAWLDKFDSESVPLTVIFPGNRPQEPILIRDLYSQSILLEKLQQAVELKTDSPVQTAGNPVTHQ